MHPSFRKLLDELSTGEQTKTEFSNSTDPASELDPRAVRSALGFDPDDETIEVRFIPHPDLLKDGPVDVTKLMTDWLKRLDRPKAHVLGPDRMIYDDLMGQFGRPDGHTPAFVTGAVTDEDNLYGNDPVPASPPTTPYPEPETGEGRWERSYAATSEVMNEVFTELASAFRGHRDMTSPHEGYAVILEELDELWKEVKRKGGGRDGKARKEALQVAAMAIRYVVNLDPHD